MTILHTNDLHGSLTPERAAFLIAQRATADLYFDTGDCVKSGNLAIPLREEPVWALLSAANCDASVIGNRETHLIEGAFRAKLAGAKHPVLCANLRKRDGTRPLPGKLICQVKGLKIGVIGLSVPMVTERMKTQAASAFLWDQPVEVAQSLCSELAGSVDVLFALTHIGLAQDRRLAEACPEISVILGGHSHSVLPAPERIGGTWICQGGSHARYLGRYEWDGRGLSGGLVEWPKG